MDNLRNISILCGMIIIFLIGGCGNEPPEKSISQRDDEERIEVVLNQILVVSLPGNPSTGYLWQVDEFDTYILQQMGKDDFEQRSGAIGAFGMQNFRFQAKKIGKTELKLSYRRPWEENVEPLENFFITIVVQ